MYRIIGVDGQQYGPVTAEQLRDWIKGGRANAQTQVQAEGSAEWKPLSAFAEFAGDLAGRTSTSAPPPPFAAPAFAAPADPDALAQEILARGFEVRIGDSISKSWELLKKDFWPGVGAAAIVMVLAGVAGAIPFLGGFISLFITGPLYGGLWVYFLKRNRGQQPTINDVFAGFSLFVPLMLAGLVTSLLTGVGILLCIIPGIYFGVCWSFTLPLVIDKKMDFWPAMELSRKVVAKKWFPVFLLGLVIGLLMLAGMIALCVGIFVAAPIGFGAMALVYDEIFGDRKPATI